MKNAWPVYVYDRPDPEFQVVDSFKLESRDEAADTIGPHVMMQVDKLREKGFTGKGVRVAVIDSGVSLTVKVCFDVVLTYVLLQVDYNHPALGGCFGKGCLVSFGYDLVGDEYNGGNQPNPDSDPVDCGSHGTHVSGIIAAQPNEAGFTGVAPGVELGVYKVFGCGGGVGTDVLISASIMAVRDGANIITASVGADGGWTNDAWTHLLTRISDEKGITCTVAAGNAGNRGAFNPSGAANGRGVNSIASFDNIDSISVLSASMYAIDSTDSKFGYAAGDPKAWNNVTLPLWARTLDTSVEDDGCAAYPDDTPDLSEYVVLVRRGTCSFVEKAKNAAAKGAKYLLIYNNVPGFFGVSVTEVKQIQAVGLVSPEIGATWINALKDGKKVSVEMVGPENAERIYEMSRNTATGGALSGFTSWGPTMEMNFKPQFGAPGGGILSTLPIKDGKYGIASGTSMSTPMVAGVVALLSEALGRVDPTYVQNILSANANPQLYNDGTKFYDYLAPVAQQGAGLVQGYDAAFTNSYLQPSSLSFNDTENLKKEMEFTLRNTGQRTVNYKVGHVPAITIYTLDEGSIYPSQNPNERINAPASLLFDYTAISLSPGASWKVKVRPTPPKGVDTKRLALWSGYITVNGTDGSSLSLPYQGLAGSLRESTTLEEKGSWIANSTDKARTPLPNGAEFVLPSPGTARVEDGIPLVMARLALGTTTLSIEIANSSSETVGKFSGVPYKFLTRGDVGFYWDGQLDTGEYVPAGDYKAIVKALRVSGDPENKDDWDTSETIVISIKYKE